MDLADKDGATPLYVAANNGHIETIRLLLGAGAKVDLANKDGATPLYVPGHERWSHTILAKYPLPDGLGKHNIYRTHIRHISSIYGSPIPLLLVDGYI